MRALPELGTYLGAAALEAAPGAAVDPKEPDDEPSIMSGVSGSMLCRYCSTGMAAGGWTGVAPADFVSGVFIGIPEFEGRNFSGNFGRGTGPPVGIGATISGVTMTISSLFVFF